METPESTTGGDETAHAFDRPLPEYVDWIAAAVIALIGLLLTTGGSALTFVVDRDLIEEGIESGQISVIVFERELTRAQMLDFTLDVVFWTGLGLLVTGVAMVVFAVAFLVVRSRAHRAAGEGESTASYRSSAVLGAVASAVLSFVPFSPVLGGGLAGYIEHYGGGRSISVGALSGFLYTLPGLVIVAFTTVGLYAGLSGVGEGGFGIVVVAGMLVTLLFVAAYGVGLGALGGFAGSRFAER